MHPVKAPKALQPQADAVVAVTDAVCLGHLDQEYAQICRKVVGKLARKRPSPLLRGDLRIWAAAVVYAVGQVNFLSDPAQSPHASSEDLCEWLGVKKSTMANKAKVVRDLLDMTHFDAEYARRDMLARNPMIWYLQIDGVVVDIRRAPLEYQEQAFELGLIPFVPGDPDRG